MASVFAPLQNNQKTSLSPVWQRQKKRAKNEKMGKLCFGASRKVEIQKRRFRDARRVVFCENEPSGSRSSKNLKNESSGCPEKAKYDISKRKVQPEK